MARAARESRQRARTIAYALARPLRGLAGRFELGAFRSLFSEVSLGRILLDRSKTCPHKAPKMIPKMPPGRSKINLRRLENLPPEAPK